jgi:hypothetical protein
MSLMKCSQDAIAAQAFQETLLNFASRNDRLVLADGCLYSLLPVLFWDRVRATVEGAVRSVPADAGLEELAL